MRPSSPILQLWASAIAALLSMLVALSLLATPAMAVEAGTRIINVASAHYFNTRLGITETVLSNRVEAVVAAVPALEIEGHSDLLLSAGNWGEYHFKVSNTGNAPILAAWRIAHAGPADMMMATDLFQDMEGNGRIDRADPVMLRENMLDLPVGETMHLIYRFSISPSAQLDASMTSELLVEGISPATDMPVIHHGTATGKVSISNHILQLRKSVEHAETEDGMLLSYTLDLHNNGKEDIEVYDEVGGSPIRIDGARAAGVLVYDPVPLNTRFVRIDENANLMELFHVHGTPQFDFVTAPPADLATVDAVAFLSPKDYVMGRMSRVGFTVEALTSRGPVDVLNIAETYHLSDEGVARIGSNEVGMALFEDMEMSEALSFMDPATGAEMEFADTGMDTGLRLIAGRCNTTPEIDVIEIAVRSERTGDEELIRATETAPNSGEFRSAPVPIVSMQSPVSFDGVIASGQADTLHAKSECAGDSATGHLQVEPGGFVFDSITNEPVARATVMLMDMSGHRMAMVETAQNGFFSLGHAHTDTYRIEVRPPASYEFPSTRTAFSGFERRVEMEGSYGHAFSHTSGPVFLMDVPLDPYYGVPLTLEKSVNKPEVQANEFVLYTVKATNNMRQSLQQAKVADKFPRNALYIPGSARLDGETIADPVLNETGQLVFDMGEITPLGSRSLEYLVRFTPTTQAGKRINEAVLSGYQAGTGQHRESNIARAEVRLNPEGGVFSRRASIMGSVYLDCNENGLRDEAEELGVPGVRIVTQEGISVVTDKDGRYSLFGLRPVSHVLALQTETLPEGTEPLASRVGDMGRPGSRMVTLSRGALQAEDFPLIGCERDIRGDVVLRHRKLSDREGKDANLLSDLPIDTTTPDQRSARSEAGLSTGTQIYRGEDLTPAEDTDGAGASEGTATLEDLIRDMEKGFDFIDLSDGQNAPRRTTNIRVKGPLDLALHVEVNGERIGSGRVGESVIWERGGIKAMELVAVRLNPGPNSIRLIGTDPFGIPRREKTIALNAPGDPATLEIIAPPNAPAIQGTVIPVVVRLLDNRGAVAQGSAVVTLEARGSVWDVTDIREEQPGIQAYVDNGEATFGLLASQAAGPQDISARTSFDSAKARIMLIPDLKSRQLVGIIEGSVGLKRGHDMIDTDALGPFEDTTTGLRGQLYLKGRIRGGALLTLRYGSDRDADERLFRDIRADQYYPVYGDSSERGFDAQSSSNLFVKVERGASYMLYGDLAIEPADPAFALGGYRGLTTGAKVHHEGERVKLSVFAARTDQQSREVEFAGRGVSGPYDVNLTDYREGSELVEILVRDEDSGEVLSTRKLRRLTDYVLDYFLNTIIFDVPVAQQDDEGNPVSVRISYQVEGRTAEKYWLYGGQVVADVNERLKVGLRSVQSDGRRGTAERFGVTSAFVEARITPRDTVVVEVAQSDDAAGNKGEAVRIAAEHVSENARVHLEASHASEFFDIQNAPTRKGTGQARLSYEYRLSERRTVSGNAEYVIDSLSGREYLAAEVALRRVIDETLIRVDGLRYSRELRDVSGEPTEWALLHGVEWRPIADGNLELDLQFELPVHETEFNVGSLLIGADYRLNERMHVVGLVELSFGPEGSRVDRADIGMTYRITDWLDARSGIVTGEAATRQLKQGFDADFSLNERISWRFGLEHSFDMGAGGDGLTSLSLGGKWESEDGLWIAEGTLDQTWEDDGYTGFSDVGIAGALSPEVTFLARSRYAYDARGAGPSQRRHRMRVGASYRAIDDSRLKVLAWYENRMEGQSFTTSDHLWSVAGTYDVNSDFYVNAKYAGQRASYNVPGSLRAKSLMQLVQAGLTWELLADRFHATLNGFHMWDSDGYSSQAVGLEAGFVLADGAMISVGYNHAKDALPFDQEQFQEGLFLRLRLKLDETLWGLLDRFLGG
ncbi:MAG: hypothetical protein CML61_12615 [Rhodobacteraceae bacterium]|nr:hypothetical protein [Paracoccaceae bacterium]